LEDRIQHGCDRPFAVGAGKMNARHRTFRLTERRGQKPHPVNAELGPLGLQRNQVILRRRVGGRRGGRRGATFNIQH
jgi:hypothetical protein